MTYMVDIDNVVDEETGEIGTIHIEVTSMEEARELIAEIIAEEDADPADFSLTPRNEWTCADCERPLLN